MRPVIQSRKHMVQVALATVGSTTTVVTGLLTAVEGEHTTSATVSEGAIVKAVWLEMWLLGAGTTVGSFTAILYKSPGGSQTVSNTDMAALHDWDNKKNILYTTQGITPETNQFPMNLHKGWIPIPKGKQRMGLNDKLQFAIRNNITDDLNFCGMVIYKEYS